MKLYLFFFLPKMLHSIFESILRGKNQLKKIKYFSDGSSFQYKIRKNFHNLCLHESDFGIPSKGKRACEGIGGTVKRLAAHASL